MMPQTISLQSHVSSYFYAPCDTPNTLLCRISQSDVFLSIGQHCVSGYNMMNTIWHRPLVSVTHAHCSVGFFFTPQHQYFSHTLLLHMPIFLRDQGQVIVDHFVSILGCMLALYCICKELDDCRITVLI